MLWIESSLKDLYKSSEDAFPRTRMRQYATQPVRVEHLEWVPFLGVRTLFVKATVRNEGRKHESIMLFKGVGYGDEKGRIPLVDSSGRKVFLKRLSEAEDDVLVRCSCGDFFNRFNYYNSLDGSLFGRKRRKYEGKGLWEANPDGLPGMCKHLMKMAVVLKESGLLN
ncbi:hypothetical protein EBT16_02295 [bacterium]|nr:hypothetical protein [bacterium]